ncbi:MAG: damage-inducible protein DinB [Flavobacteriales bacterium]|nr:damage-inducible protein DinB [Flavobacteriales bacterium]
MKPFFKQLFEYSHHFNQKLGDVFLAHSDTSSEKAVTLFNHIINAHQIWNGRIQREETLFGVWEIHPVGELQRIDKSNFDRTLTILEATDLNASVSYQNSKGQRFQNSVRDVLFHIVNHSTYHRGQIATELKRCGLEPLVTDYIFYKR